MEEGELVDPSGCNPSHTHEYTHELADWLTNRSCCFSLQPTNQPHARTQRERQKPDEKKMKFFSISAIILGALPALVAADFDLKDRLRQFRDPSNAKKEVRNSMTWYGKVALWMCSTVQ